MKIIELTKGVPEDQRLVNLQVKRMREAGAERHPVLQELGLYVFWGARVWAYVDSHDVPLSIHASKLGKKKTNVWLPCVNWYAAYTLPEFRRKGYAYRLYAEMEKEAVRAGCRHVKSLAGSSAGLGLHKALGHRCWGQVPTGEVFVYSPLPGHEHIYPPGAVPPQAPSPKPLTQASIDSLIRRGLRYDHAN